MYCKKLAKIGVCRKMVSTTWKYFHIILQNYHHFAKIQGYSKKMFIIDFYYKNSIDIFKISLRLATKATKKKLKHLENYQKKYQYW